MTVEQIWEDIKGLKPNAADRARELLTQLLATQEGRNCFRSGLKKQKPKVLVLRHFVELMEPAGTLSSELPPQERSTLLEEVSRVAHIKDAVYWRLLWLRLKGGQRGAVAADARDSLKALSEGGAPKALVEKLKNLKGWADLPCESWVEVVENAVEAELSSENRAYLKDVVQLLQDRPAPTQHVAELSAGAESKQERGSTQLDVGNVQTSPSATGIETNAKEDAAEEGGRTKPRRASRRSPNDGAAQGGSETELVGLLASCISAVHALSERLGTVSRNGGATASDQRIHQLDQRISQLETTQTTTESEARAWQGEVERLQAELRNLGDELQSIRGERDAELARAGDLQQRLAAADARIAAAEGRADQHIHNANQERDLAVLTFKAQLWDAMRPHLEGVADPRPGETFGAEEAKVLMVRLRRIRDVLRSDGIPP